MVAQAITKQELLNYRLQEQIGQEELSTTYLATHTALERPVQVHILRRTDWISVSRFHLAARLAANVSHPNLLPVIDAGHDEIYGDYLVTPMIAARPLSALLEEGPLDPIHVLRIATQLASVLDYLHAQQIVHRDVQPSNILLTDEGTTYLTNLSLAASSDTPDLSSIDEADYLTPYSAPEQRLDQSEATPMLDVYSLGALIYHMLSGNIPPAPEMDVPSLAILQSALADTDAVIQRMMHVNPALRFQSAGDAIKALRRALHIHIDLPDDGEDSTWQTIAEWFENPLETVMQDMLDQEYLGRSRKRADAIHHRETITRLLNRWSKRGFFRRDALGHIIQIEQVASYNIYFYELKTWYETRVPLPPKQRAQREQERSSPVAMLPLWEVVVPDVPPFEPVDTQELIWPNSKRVFTCPDCSGLGNIQCQTCLGKGTRERSHKVRNPDNSVTTEIVPEACPTCHGYRQQVCSSCAGSGNLVEEQRFAWSRRVYLWKNSDDVDDLPHLAIQKRTEVVYHDSINPYDGRWHSITPMSELLREAIADAGNETRILAADLCIRGTPITEVEYHLNEKSTLERLYIVGFDHEIVGTWSLLNYERIILVVVGVLFIFSVIAIALSMYQ